MTKSHPNNLDTIEAMMRMAGTQAMGFWMIPSEVYAVTRHEFGVVGLLPTMVTDPGAAVLVLILLFALARSLWNKPGAATKP